MHKNIKNEASSEIQPPGENMFDRQLFSVWRIIPFNLKATFVSTLVASFVLHGYMFSNLMLNQDGFAVFYSRNNPIELGRFFNILITYFRGNVISPWVVGVLSVTIAAFAACALVKILKLSSVVASVMLGMTLMSFPSVISIFSFLNISFEYYVSILLFCLGLYIAEHYQKIGWIFAGGIFGFAMGIYPAYIFFAAGLYVMLLMMDILRGADDLKVEAIKAVKYFFSLILGIIIYFLTLQAALLLQNATLATYQGINNTGNINMAEIPMQILRAYGAFANFFTQNRFGGYEFGNHFDTNIISRHIYIIVGLACFLMMCITISKRNIHLKGRMLVFFALLCISFPFSLTAVYLMGAETVSMVMLYPLVLVPIFTIAVLDLMIEDLPTYKKSRQKTLKILTYLQIAVLLFIFHGNYIVINQAYMKAQLTLLQTYQFTSSLVERIEAFPEYSAGMEIYPVGYPPLEYTWSELKNNAIGLDGAASVVGSYSYARFIEIYCGSSINIKDFFSERYSDWIGENMSAIQDMETYPHERSIRVIDDKMVIKLSEIVN
jgi:hypothetical protein